MRVLLVTDSYPPEIRSASHLMLELAEELLARGHQVTVATTWPKYNLEEGRSSQEFKAVTDENGIHVIRLKTLPHHKVSYLVRGIAQLVMPLQFIWKIFRLRKHKFDALVIYSPPLPLALVGSWYRFRGARYVLNVQDLFPQSAIDLDALRNKFLIWFFRRMERFAYGTADVVTFHSEGNREFILREYPSLEDRIDVVHNWVDVEHHDPDQAPVRDFRQVFGLNHKFIAVFAGVISVPQYLELIVQLAQRMQDCTELLFLLVGDGAEKQRLEELARAQNLHNIEFRPFVTRDDYPDLLKICSVGLVCLSPKSKTPVVPGKILGYMAAKLPCIAFLHPESDGHSIIAEAKCGYSAFSEDVDACETIMRKIYNERDKISDMGKAGRQYALENFSKPACVTHIERLLQKPKNA